MCVCLLLVRAKAKIKRNKYGATRSAGDYQRKVQLARLCALGGKDMVSFFIVFFSGHTLHLTSP